MATVYERVKNLVVERLGVDEAKVTPQASFTEDLNVDSLDLVELIMALEEEFAADGSTLEMTDEEAENIQTIQETVDFLKSRGIRDSNEGPRRKHNQGYTKRTVHEIYLEFKQYEVSDEELRATLSAELGNRTLTEELYTMREG